METRIRKEIRKQYLIVGAVTLGIAIIGIVAGFLLDRAYDTQPMYMLIALLVSAPITIWINFTIIKRKLKEIASELENNTFKE